MTTFTSPKDGNGMKMDEVYYENLEMLWMNFVNQLLESKSLQVLCLPCHPWNSGSSPGGVEPRRPYDTLSVRLRASFLCSWEVPRTWSNWQTQMGNFPSMEIHLFLIILCSNYCIQKKTEQISASSQTIPHCHMLNQIRATGLWRYSAESRRGTKCPATFSKYSATPEHVFTVRIKAFSGIQFKKIDWNSKINEMPLNA